MVTIDCRVAILGTFRNGACFQRQCRGSFRLYERDQDHVAGIKARENEARNERAFVHVADRAAELVGHHDQHQRRRDDLRERARCRDDARSQSPVVAVAQHDRQRDQAHRNHRCRDDAGRRREQRADEDHRIGKAAADRAEYLTDGVEQVFGHAASFEHQSHEGKERNRQQRIVGHYAAVDAFGQRGAKARTRLIAAVAESGASSTPMTKKTEQGRNGGPISENGDRNMIAHVQGEEETSLDPSGERHEHDRTRC
jgi:hypothetical protein